MGEHLEESATKGSRRSQRLKLLVTLGLLLVVTIPLLIFTKCGRSRQVALRELEQQGIPFTEGAFLERVNHGEIDLVRLFLAAGINPDARDQKGDTALMIAIAANGEAVAEALLKGGASVNARTKNGSTALHTVALMGNEQIAQMLVKRKAEVNAKTDIGETPLMIAALRGYPGTAKLLLAAGADVNAKDARGETPLMHAMERNHPEVIEVLKAASARE